MFAMIMTASAVYSSVFISFILTFTTCVDGTNLKVSVVGRHIG